MNRFLTILFALSTALSFGQKKLSRNDALVAALANNFDVQIADKEFKIAQNDNTWGMAGRLPSLQFTLGQANQLTNQDNPTSFVQGTLKSFNVNPALDLNWTIFNGFKVKATKSKLERLETISEGNATVVVEATVQAVVNAYNDCLVQEAKSDRIKQAMGLSRDKLKRARISEKTGLITALDFSLIKDSYLVDSTNFLTQELNKRNAYRNLNLLLGLKSDTSFRLSDTLYASFNEYNLSTLEEEMIQNNSQYKNQYTMLFLRNSEIEISKSALYPTINLNLGSTYTQSSFSHGTLGTGSGSSAVFYARFSLAFTLFNGGQVKRNIEKANLQFEVDATKSDQLELTLKNDLSTTLDSYNTGRILYGALLEREKIAEKKLILAKLQYDQGLISELDFRDIQLQAVTASISTLEMLNSIAISETNLARLTGGIIKL